MLTQNDLERERYNARVKLARDERGLLKAAMEEGLKKGRLEGEAKGQLIGRIRVFEELLGHPASSDDQLAQLSPAELQQQAERLAEQLRQRQN